ncbi:MAG: GAF domain-containing protein [Dehalococcoidales bacterium]|nr:GAF domain-containing protein [Dehalococcoidales bacterium]
MDNLILIPLICAVIYGTLTVIALLRITRVRVVFALYLFTAVLWSLSSAMTHYNLGDSQTYFWGKMIVTACLPMIVFYYQFVRNFTRKKTDIWTCLGYAAMVACSIVSSTGLFLKDVLYSDGNLKLVYSPVATAFVVGFILCYVTATAGILVSYYRNSLDRIERRKTVYLLVGMGVFAFFSLSKAVPGLAQYQLDYVGGTLNAVIISYVILKYQLLDIKLVLRKGLVYSGLTVFLSTVYLLLLAAVQLFFQDKLGYTSLALAAIIALMTAVLFSPLRDLLQKVIDRLFYRDTYDYRRMLLSFSNRINNVLDLDELQHSIIQPLVESMRVKKAALLFPEVGTGEYCVRFINREGSDTPFSKFRLLNDNPIITWLGSKGEVLKRDMIEIVPQFKGLWEVEKTTLDVTGVELLCPIQSKGQLIGILALGEKETGEIFTDEEADLIKTMSNEAAVALENARMLDNIKSQQLQVEQLLGQVVLAQEEERNRISIDLHDSVAQWLVAVSYGIQTYRHALPEEEAEKARAELTDMEKTITKSLKELRRVVVGLRPPSLDELGLTHSIQQILHELEADGIQVQYFQTGNPVRLPSSIEIAVYRVVQEAITNIRKHAKATRVKLDVGFHEDGLQVEITDNGHGFNLSRTLDSAITVGHLGLLGMRQRADMLGGRMDIRTSEGVGTTISFDFPVGARLEER